MKFPTETQLKKISAKNKMADFERYGRGRSEQAIMDYMKRKNQKKIGLYSLYDFFGRW